ncbi:AIF1L factor, partial [Columbina picui]|nr:AIF1L factor [Columbina picui]
EMAAPRRPSGGGLRRAPQDGRLEEINKEFLCDPKFSDEEDLEEKLAVFKEKYMEFDLNNQGEIADKIIPPPITGKNAPAFVSVVVFVVFCRVMMFEGKANESNPKPSGPPPERDIASLP